VVQAKLDAEAPGILAWCVTGAVDYLRDGLGPEPECVRAATREYEEEEDTLGRFLEECTKPVAEAWTSSKDLYAAYKAWCSDSGVTPEAQVQFGRELVRHGVMSHARNGRKGYLGVQLEGTLV
jgi:putative DNA primase/helicase